MPHEALVSLRHRLEALPARHPDRKGMIANAAALYGVSRATLYRGLHRQLRPQPLHRSDRGKSKVIPAAELERYCETIAAMKLRTLNKKGRHLSTAGAIRILEEHGVETPDGPVRLRPGLLSKATANRYLREWGYDHERMTRPPAAVRFQAEHSNALWHFDLSPSDLKQVDCPSWIEPGRGTPTLMIYSIVDDRSGVAYQEYHGVYGEDVEAALRFLFNAMAPKPEEDGSPFQGIPAAIYSDNGPIIKSAVFRRVMEHLGVAVLRHLPAGKDGRRPTARSKGKVERPFRTVKEAHETLYHFHKPESEAEANRWLKRYLAQYNAQQHRSETHTRIEDWLENLPDGGLREMCSWERFCAFAREPERRQVGGDARISVAGTLYEVDADLAGETVLLWWGLFDQDLYVEFGTERYGPYHPAGGPIPLHHYRQHRKGRREQRADRVAVLAAALQVPRAVLDGYPALAAEPGPAPPRRAFVDPDPFREFTFSNRITAKLAIVAALGMPLARLAEEERAFIDEVLAETLERRTVMGRVMARLRPARGTPC
ncbi:MAG: IS481 family transposase [Bradyrhizobium sp.]